MPKEPPCPPFDELEDIPPEWRRKHGSRDRYQPPPRYADMALPPESRPPPTYVKLDDIPAVVAEWRRMRGLPDPTPPEGLNKFERMAWVLRQLRDQLERQGKLLAALRARMKD